MSRNSSGTYTLPTGNPVVSGTVIEANWANTTLDDISAALTDSLSRSGKGGMSAPLRIIDGSVSVPGWAFGNETGSGAYRSAAGDWYLTVLGANIARLRASGVDVTGAFGVSGNATINGQTLTLENSTAYYPQIINRNKTADANGSYFAFNKMRNGSIVQNGDVLGNLIFSGYDGASYLQGAYINAVVSATPGTNDMPTDLAFGTTADGGAGPTEHLRITQAGYVGIGTSSPSAPLTVKTGASWDLYAKFTNTSGYPTVRFADSSNVPSTAFITAGTTVFANGASSTEAMRIDSSCNLLVGLSSGLGAKMEVRAGQGNGLRLSASGTGANGPVLIFNNQINSGSYPDIASIIGTLVDGSASYAGDLVFQCANGGTLGERARLASNGRFSLGRQNYLWNANEKLTVQGAINGAVASFGPLIGAGNVGQIIFTGNNGGLAGYIQFETNTTAYVTSSDYRLKENIQPMQNALETVSKLNPVTYKWKSDGSDGQGFIAHELQAVLPDCVTGEKDAVRTVDVLDDEGRRIGTTEEPMYQGVDTSFLVATLVKAIQELKAEVDALKAAAK